MWLLRTHKPSLHSGAQCLPSTTTCLLAAPRRTSLRSPHWVSQWRNTKHPAASLHALPAWLNTPPFSSALSRPLLNFFMSPPVFFVQTLYLSSFIKCWRAWDIIPPSVEVMRPNWFRWHDFKQYYNILKKHCTVSSAWNRIYLACCKSI